MELILIILLTIVIVVTGIVNYRDYNKKLQEKEVESYKRTDSKWLKIKIRVLRRSKVKGKRWNSKKGK